MRRRWTVTTYVTGRERRFDVILYDRLQDLRAATTRFSAVAGEPESGSTARLLGAVQSFQRFRITPTGEVERPEFGFIRLCRNHLTTEIVSHELAHLAAALYGIDMVGDTDLAADHLHSGNEPLAEVFADLFTAVWPLVADQIQPD